MFSKMDRYMIVKLNPISIPIHHNNQQFKNDPLPQLLHVHCTRFSLLKGETNTKGEGNRVELELYTCTTEFLKYDTLPTSAC